MTTTETIDVRDFMRNAIQTGSFDVPFTPEPPPAQLDGAPIDFRAVLHALLGGFAAGNSKTWSIPGGVDHDDLCRALHLYAELAELPGGEA